MKNTYVLCAAIAGITSIEIMALMQGWNGTYIMGAFTAIAGITGVAIGQKIK